MHPPIPPRPSSAVVLPSRPLSSPPTLFTSATSHAPRASASPASRGTHPSSIESRRARPPTIGQPVPMPHACPPLHPSLSPMTHNWTSLLREALRDEGGGGGCGGSEGERGQLLEPRRQTKAGRIQISNKRSPTTIPPFSFLVLLSSPHPSPLPRTTPLARLAWDASIKSRRATSHQQATCAPPVPQFPFPGAPHRGLINLSTPALLTPGCVAWMSICIQ